MEHIQNVLDWAEKHAGLGGWVGAVGAVIAIFVTWGIARSEYTRTRRLAVARRNSLIDTMKTVVQDFESEILQNYLTMAEKDQTRFWVNQDQMHDAEYEAMQDLAHMPVVDWPSSITYLKFKRYWRGVNAILEIVDDWQLVKIRVSELGNGYSELLDALEDAKSDKL